MVGSDKVKWLILLGLWLVTPAGLNANPDIGGNSELSVPPSEAPHMVPLPTPAQQPEAQQPLEYVHHIVLVEFKPQVNRQQQAEIIDQALNLLSTIPVVEEIYIGPKAQSDRAVHIKNYDIAIYIRLRRQEDILSYRAHQNHRRFLQQNNDKLAWIQVLDFAGKTASKAVATESVAATPH